jgi:hypothetical protein
MCGHVGGSDAFPFVTSYQVRLLLTTQQGRESDELKEVVLEIILTPAI